MKAFVVFSSCLVSASDGATSLKMFIDPRHVSSKNLRKSPCSTTASTCDPPDLDLLDEQGFLQSQDGEDRCLIEHFFPGVCQGKYLEVGALDGVRWSNTYAFHKVLGWKGVNIEIDPYNYESLSLNRRDDLANVPAAVCSDPQKTVHYAIGKDDRATGGIWEYASEAHREEYWPGMTIYDAIPMKCTPLQSILDKTVGTRKYFFDLAVLDLEGAEFSALLGIDYNQISFGVVIVEKNEDGNINQQVEDLLSSKGYSVSNVEAKCGTRNLWFVHQNFHSIYSQLR